MAHVPPSPEPFDTNSAALLALRACDDIGSLHDVRLAYACIEQLVVPQHASDSEDVHPIRTELSALMRLVNEELQRRISALSSVRMGWTLSLIHI